MSNITSHTGGYEVRNLSHLPTGAFHGYMYRDGARIFEVSNDGNGGLHMIQSSGDENVNFRAEFQALEEYAKSQFDSFEPIDYFISALLDIADIHHLSTRNSVPFSTAAAQIVKDLRSFGDEYFDAEIALIEKVGEGGQ